MCLPIALTLAGIMYAGCLEPARAQNVNCTTRPLGDSTNACASTAFVQNNSPVVTAILTPDTSTAYSATNAAANAAALNTAMANGRCAFIPYNAFGYSFAGNTVAVGTGQCILGENQVLTKWQPTGSGYGIHVTAFEVVSGPAIIDNVKMDMTGAGATSTAIRFATATNTVAGVQLSRLLCTNCVEFIGDEVHATNYVTDIKLSDIRALLTLGRQIFIRRSRGFMWLDSIRIDQTCSVPICGAAQVTPVTWSSARFVDFIGLEINRFDSLGPVTTTYQAAVNGLEVVGSGSGNASVWLNRILVDNGSGNGISVSTVNYLNANWIESFGNLGTGITLTTVSFSEVTNAFIVGGVGITGAAAGANGFTCSACANLNLANLLSSNNTGSGLSISGASSAVAVANYQATGNTLFATVLAGTANAIVINGGSWTSNGGTLSNGSTGANIVIRNVNGFPQRTAVADVNYTVLTNDEIIAYTSISTARTVTLPSAALFPAGRILTIEDVSGSATSAITISAAPNGTDTINGSNTTQVMVRNAYGSVALESNGVGAWVFSVKGMNTGGTGAGLTPNNGGILYSTAAQMAILAGTATANQALLSGASTTPAWSTATYPPTTTINQILYSSAANVIGGIPTGNSMMFTTNSSGVPFWTVSPAVSTTSNSPIGPTVTNLSTGTGGLATLSVQNSAATSLFGMASTGYTGIALLQGKLFMDASGASQGAVVNTEAALPIDFGVNNTRAGGFIGANSDFGIVAHLRGQGTTPTLTAGCNGAGSSVAGSDLGGTVTGQTAAATTCTLTFATAFGTAANCVAMGQSSPLTGAATPGTATLVVNFASTANYKFSYVCVANTGG